MKTNVCRTCGKDLGSDVKCTYCGKIFVEATDPKTEERLNKLGKESRMEIVGRIKAILTEIHKGEPLSDKCEVPKLNTMKVKIADGSDCYGKIVWADENIWQDQSVNLDKTIPVSYMFDGKEYTTEIQIKTRRTNDWWKFGVRLEENLHLRFFLGTKDNYSQSELVPLKLI